MKRSLDDTAHCAICLRPSDDIWPCSFCQREVCKAHRSWCSEIFCDITVCRSCQDFGSRFQIKRVCAMNYFCVRHLRNVCFFCASPYLHARCSDCPRRMCARHCSDCSTPRCWHSLCVSCSEVPFLAMFHHVTGDICRRCADRRTPVRISEWSPPLSLSSSESETSTTASRTANANVAVDLDEPESPQSSRGSRE